MLTSNLLPLKEKREVMFEKWRRVIKFFGINTTLLFFVGTTLLTPSYLPLYFQGKELTYQLAIQEEALQRINTDQIKQNEKKILSKILSLRQAAEIPNKASLLFDAFSPQLQGITVQTFTINKAGDISFIGNASTRENLLDFEQYLRNTGRLQDLTFPMMNLFPQTNINFTFKGKIKSIYGL